MKNFKHDRWLRTGLCIRNKGERASLTLLLLVFALLAAGPSSWAGFDFDPATRRGSGVSPDIQKGANGTMIGVYKGLDNAIQLSRSVDGTNWSAPEPAVGPNNSLGEYFETPTIATDGNGHWMLVWQLNIAPPSPSNPPVLQFSVSSDNGVTWSPRENPIANPEPQTAHLHPMVVTDSRGTWICIWETQRDCGDGTTGNILVTRTENFGDTWSAPAPVSPTTLTACINQFNPRLTTNENGSWMAVWDSEAAATGSVGTDRDIFSAYSVNAGQTWSIAVAVNSDAQSDSADDVTPDIAQDGAGRWMAAWAKGGKITTSTTGDGTTWSSPSTVGVRDVHVSSRPRVRSASPGSWAMAWQTLFQYSNGASLPSNYRPVAGRSTDNGQSWLVNYIFNPNFADPINPTLLVWDLGRVLVAWASSGADYQGFWTDLSNNYFDDLAEVEFFYAEDFNLYVNQLTQNTVILKNRSPEFWSSQTGFYLNVPADPCGIIQGGRVDMDPTTEVGPGETLQLYFPVHAPAQAGECPISYQFAKDGRGGLSGIFNATARIYSASNLFVGTDLPASMLPNQTLNVQFDVPTLKAFPPNFAMEIVSDPCDMIRTDEAVRTGDAGLTHFNHTVTAPPIPGVCTIGFRFITREFVASEPVPFSEVFEVSVRIEPMFPFTVDFDGDNNGWSGGTLIGSGSVRIGPAGICMEVPLLGDNIVGWVSPESYVPLIDNVVYQIQVQPFTDQLLPDTIPVWDMIYDNFPANGYGGENIFIDVAGGANGISRPQGRATFEMWAAPNAVETVQWRGVLPNGDNSDGAFTPHADAINDMRLVTRIVDLDSANVNAQIDFGSICISRLVINTHLIPELAPIESVYSTPISTTTHGVETFDQMEGGFAQIDDATHTARFQLTESGVGARKTLFPWDRTPGAATEFYPIPWESDQLYKGTMRVSSGLAAEGSDPVDLITLAFDEPSNEVVTTHVSVRGTPGGYGLASSPRLASSTYDIAQPYVGFFYSHNVSALDPVLFPTSHYFRLQGDFTNSNVIVPQAQGADPLVVSEFKVEKVAMP